MVSTFDVQERKVYREAPTDPVEALEHELRLTTVREARMLKRIHTLQCSADADGMTTVEITRKTGIGADEDSDDGTGPIDITTTKRRGVLGQIQDIEEALTRVQANKARLVEALIRAKEVPSDNGQPDAARDLVNAMYHAANLQRQTGGCNPERDGEVELPDRGDAQREDPCEL